jgi:hypothetical protein
MKLLLDMNFAPAWVGFLRGALISVDRERARVRLLPLSKSEAS